LQLFSLHWLPFRGLALPPGESDVAKAIITQDLARLKELIGGREVNEMSMPVGNLPASVLRWGRDAPSLLEVASSVGEQSLRYILEFHRMRPGHRCLCQAVAFGDPETIRMIWDRMDEYDRIADPEVLRIAIDFHHPEVSIWLLAEQPSWYLIARTFGILNYRYCVVEKMRVLKAEEISRPSQQTLDDMVSDAVKRDDGAWLKAAIVLGGSPDAIVRNGSARSQSAIVLAASRRNTKMVRALLQHGAQVGGTGGWWCTALAEAGKHFEIVSLLLIWGANPNTGDAGSWDNPLVVAAHGRGVDCLRLMIEHRGDPSRADSTGNVLHGTLPKASPECLTLLFEHGADPNAIIPETGDTPLHSFAERDDGRTPDESIRLLDLMRAAGALPLPNEAGVFPVTIARRNARMSEAVLRWFEEWNV
jgi:hypothetical protein